MAPSRYHGERIGSLKSQLSQILQSHPRSNGTSGSLSKNLGIGPSKASKLQKSSSVGATYNPCACYNDPSMGLTSYWVSTFNSCCIQQNGGPCNYIGPCT